MFALIQSENHASNKGKTAGRYQFDTHPTGIGLRGLFNGNLEKQMKLFETRNIKTGKRISIFLIVNNIRDNTLQL